MIDLLSIVAVLEMKNTAELTQPSTHGRRLLLVVVVLLIVAAVVTITHWPGLSAEAMLLDDADYLSQNPLVKNPSLYKKAKSKAKAKL